MNTVREIQRINEAELKNGVPDSASWHAPYANSAWVYIGGLSSRLSEGDVIAVFSQWGEVEDIHLVRDEATGESKGFAFLKYEDSRSAVLAVDNMVGVTLLGRTLRVDHKLSYEPPKPKKDKDGTAPAAAEDTGPVRFQPGHAYAGKELANEYDIAKGVNIFSRSTPAGIAGAAASVGASSEGRAASHGYVGVDTEGPGTDGYGYVGEDGLGFVDEKEHHRKHKHKHGHRHEHKHHKSSRRERSRSHDTDDRRRRRHRSREERRSTSRGERRHSDGRSRSPSWSRGHRAPPPGAHQSEQQRALPARRDTNGMGDLPPAMSWRGYREQQPVEPPLRAASSSSAGPRPRALDDFTHVAGLQRRR